jgi:hypothetical protein
MFGGERREKRAIAIPKHICEGTTMDLEECGLHSSGSGQGPVQDLVISLRFHIMQRISKLTVEF